MSVSINNICPNICKVKKHSRRIGQVETDILNLPAWNFWKTYSYIHIDIGVGHVTMHTPLDYQQSSNKWSVGFNSICFWLYDSVIHHYSTCEVLWTLAVCSRMTLEVQSVGGPSFRPILHVAMWSRCFSLPSTMLVESKARKLQPGQRPHELRPDEKKSTCLLVFLEFSFTSN